MRYLLIACLSVLFSVNSFAEKVKRDFEVKDFSKISVASGFDVFISQGDKESASVELNDDMEKYLIVEVENNTLKVYLKKRSFFKTFRRTGSMKVTIVVKDITSLSVSGGGDIKISELVVDKLSTSVSGGGSLDLTIKTEELKCSISGGGDVLLKGEAEDARVSISGGGNAKIYCENTESLKAALSGGGNIIIDGELKEIALSISGGGNARLRGKANYFKASVTGGGGIAAKEFKIDNCKLSLSGGSEASINVSGDLKLSVSGGGDVKCYGKPENIIKSLSGGSKLRIIQ